MSAGGACPIGISLLLWTPVLRRAQIARFARLRELGYDGVELPLVGVEPSILREARAVLGDLGMRCTAVGFAPPEADPIDPDPAGRARALDHLRRLVDDAAAVGAELVAGPLHSAYARFAGRGPTEAELACSAEVLHAAAEHAAAAGIRLGVEYLNRFECYLVNTAAATDALVRRAGHPSLGTVYDTHHAHLEERSVAGALADCAATLLHVQISESHRGELGTGQVRWDETFAALARIGYRGWLVVESFSRVDPEFGALLHIWRDFAASPDRVCESGIAFARERGRE
jgi:D-psicose/D-tagatose/L-ribulose 3-epimerase